MFVHVKVIDRSMPVFDKQFYTVSVPENIELFSPLDLSISAESALGRKLIYSIVNGNDYEEFAVDFNSGKCIRMRQFIFDRFPPGLLTSWRVLVSKLSFCCYTIPGFDGVWSKQGMGYCAFFCVCMSSPITRKFALKLWFCLI